MRTLKEYLELVANVLEHGERKPSRTGVDTISLFGAHYSVDLAAGFPLLTTKKMQWTSLLHELLWYLSGDNHVRNLSKHTKIWDAWADENGELETAYGHYWRHFPSATKTADGTWQVTEIDQIGNVLNCLRNEPTSRRMVVTAWEPGNAWGSRLPPCHYTYAFHVSGGKLNCHLTQRSGDVALGIPFNLAAYAALTQMLAQEVGLTPGRFAHSIVDAHIYCAKPDGSGAEFGHIDGLREQLTREPKPLPQLIIADKPFEQLSFHDFELRGYAHHPPIKFKVAV
ncbi:MAG: thymidylate synthase [Planctomycetota bacterium]|nr:MAG: thymidylate synthase [Planctomycetota bacterium]